MHITSSLEFAITSSVIHDKGKVSKTLNEKLMMKVLRYRSRLSLIKYLKACFAEQNRLLFQRNSKAQRRNFLIHFSFFIFNF